MSINKSAQQVGYKVNAQLNTAIQDIYHFSHSSSHSQFRHHVLNTLRKLIHCDSAHWATVDADTPPKICSLYSDFNKQLSVSIKSANTENYLATDLLTSDIEQLISARLNARQTPSTIPFPIVCYDDSNINNQSNNIPNLLNPASADNHRLVSIERSTQTKLYDIIILQRGDSQEEFNNDESKVFQQMIPHILEAYGINLSHNRLLNNFSTRTAVCDLKGNLLLADNEFSATLCQLHSQTHANKLPGGVFESLLEKNIYVYGQRKILMTARIIDDLLFIRFLQERRHGGLSGEERLVTKYMIQGQNHIDMAKQLKLPTSSILYIVNCIYKKLGIKNKAQLNMIFSGDQENITMA